LVILPVIAAAAAVKGLAEMSLAPGPCLPSKVFCLMLKQRICLQRIFVLIHCKGMMNSRLSESNPAYLISPANPLSLSVLPPFGTRNEQCRLFRWPFSFLLQILECPEYLRFFHLVQLQEKHNQRSARHLSTGLINHVIKRFDI